MEVNIGQTSEGPPPEVTNTPLTQVSQPTGDESAWTDQKHESIYQKYKQDPKEMSKALWNKDKEFSKTQQEINQLRTQLKQFQTQQTQQTQQKVVADTALEKPNSVKAISYVEIDSRVYTEVFETGNISEETKQLLSQDGMPDWQIRNLVERNKANVENTRKEAQSFVSTPLDDLKKFAEAEGNYSDSELNQIQQSLNSGFYGILKDIERKYKTTQKTVVQHGDGPAGKINAQGFNSLSEYNSAKNAAKTSEELSQIKERYLSSDTQSWFMGTITGR